MNARLLHPCRSCAHVKYETNMWWCMLKCMENIYIYSMRAQSVRNVFSVFLYVETIICTNYITKRKEQKAAAYVLVNGRTHRLQHTHAHERCKILFPFFQSTSSTDFSSTEWFSRKNAGFRETNEIKQGKRKKTLKGFECVCKCDQPRSDDHKFIF